MGPFLTVALDVPRRMARSKLLWLLVGVIGLLLLVAAAPVGFGTNLKNAPVMTYFGFEMSPLDPTDPETRFKIASAYLTFVFPLALGSCLGVFCGLLLLADAVPSAFAPGAAEITLSKPMHRGTVVCARHLGAVLVALGLATFLIGGAVAIVYIRTGVFCPLMLVTIPLTVLQFAALHAMGTITALSFQSSLLGAFASTFVWISSWLTSFVARHGEQFLDEAARTPELTRHYSLHLVELTTQIARIAHRTIPRAADFPELVIRIPTRHFGTLPTGVQGEVELVVQMLLWVGIALGVATLVVRRRDY